MRKYVIMGVQGSGKGTQSKLLCDGLDLVHMSVGDIFRWNVQNHTKMGAQVRRIMAEGLLVSDEMAESVVRGRLTEHDWNYGFIIDGFPRNRRQTEFFLESYDIDGVIELDMPDSEVRRRVLARRLCSNCGMDYNLLTNSPTEPGKCDVCAGELITREDDTDEALAVRLKEFHEKTNPVLDLFRRKEYVITVDATRPPPVVQQDIRTKLGLPALPGDNDRAGGDGAEGKGGDDKAAVTNALDMARGDRRALGKAALDKEGQPDRPGWRTTEGVTVREIAVFSGGAHPLLATEITENLGVPLEPVRFRRFADDCLEVQLQANCRERDVFLIQPLVPPVQENLVELLLMADAARGASAGRVTIVVPHYAYARSDKKDEPRISIAGRLVADLLVTAGANRVLTMTLHSPQVHGFFSVPVDHLNALRELAGHFGGRDLSNAVVVSPDLGYAKSAAAFARRLSLPVAAGAKQRHSDDSVTISSIIGDVAGRDVIVLDDEIARGTTLMELLSRLREQDVRSVSIACTHGLFVDGALGKLVAQPDVTEVICTNTVPVPEHKRDPKLDVISVAPALAEAIRRIHDGESVSDLFDHP